MGRRESKIERLLVEGVEALGGTCEKFVSPGKIGVPDRIISWPVGSPQARDISGGWTPATEFAETKALGGKLESWQERDHARRRAMGFEVHVPWSEEQVEAYLRSRGKR